MRPAAMRPTAMAWAPRRAAAQQERQDNQELKKENRYLAQLVNELEQLVVDTKKRHAAEKQALRDACQHYREKAETWHHRAAAEIARLHDLEEAWEDARESLETVVHELTGAKDAHERRVKELQEELHDKDGLIELFKKNAAARDELIELQEKAPRRRRPQRPAPYH
jgi:hypothetical protein